MFMHSCVSEVGQRELIAEKGNLDIGEMPTVDQLIAQMENIEKTNKPKSVSKIDISTLDRNQKEIYLASQSRSGNCLPGIPVPEYSRTINVSNNLFSAQVDYTYRYYVNNGVSISSMNVTPDPGFYADQFLLIDKPIDSPTYSSIFNFFRSYLYAFIASDIEDDVLAQPGVMDFNNSGGFIFMNVENKLINTCWDDPEDGACSGSTWGPTCCQRYSWYWSSDGTQANFGRYLDANGNALISGSTSTYECFGSGSNRGPATWNSRDYCDDSSMGFNSLQ